MDIIDHIKKLHKRYGNNFQLLDNTSQISEFYSIIKKYSRKIKFNVSENHHNQLKYLLAKHEITFDNYLIYLNLFLEKLSKPYDLKSYDYYGYFVLINMKIHYIIKQNDTEINNIIIELINIKRVGIINHIKELDKKHGNKLHELYKRKNLYDTVLDFYFQPKVQQQLQLNLSDLYNKKLDAILSKREIDLDQYIMYIQRLCLELYGLNLTPNSDGVINLDDNIRFRKSFNNNEFVFCTETPTFNIRITFVVNAIEEHNQPPSPYQCSAIELTNITIVKPRDNIYWYKLGVKVAPYILSIILVMLIIFSIFTDSIMSFTQSILDKRFYPIFAYAIAIFCGVVTLSPVYKIIDAFRKYLKISLSFKINQKYSNTENYLAQFSQDKKNKSPLFENLERPISVPSEDYLGFNLLSAWFYYNSVINRFDPNINLIKIIDAKRGMGKSSFINLLVQRINGFTYRHDANCELFKKIFNNKQIEVVKFSIMPFLASLNDENENQCIDNFITFIADNLTPQSSKYLKAILSSTTSFNGKFNLEKFINQINNSDSIDKLKNKLKLLERKNLIIIEDLDRLNEKQLKIFAKALWFIYELPFTITLLPAEAEKIKRAINLPVSHINDTNHYEELEEYKLLQPSFSLSEYFYDMLATYFIKLFDASLSKLQINDEFIQIKQLNNNEITLDKIQNDWVLHLYKNIIPNRNKIVQFNPNHNIIDSIKNELIHLFKKYNISLRECKQILEKLCVSGNNLFILQQVLFYLLESRYKYYDGVEKYLKKYITSGDYKKNPHLSIFSGRFNNEHDSFAGELQDIRLDLERLPVSIMRSYISSLFGFALRVYRHPSSSINFFNVAASADILNSDFIVIFLTGNNAQILYDTLSMDWRARTQTLSLDNFSLILTSRDAFILAFNERADTSVIENTKNHKFSYNLFLYQNFAILLLLIIRDRLTNELEPVYLDSIYNYFNGDKLYNHSIRIYNQFYDTTISFEIDVMRNYFRRLFNINYDTFEYDTSYEILQQNCLKLQELLITDKTDHRFRDVFNKIFQK